MPGPAGRLTSCLSSSLAFLHTSYFFPSFDLFPFPPFATLPSISSPFNPTHLPFLIPSYPPQLPLYPPPPPLALPYAASPPSLLSRSHGLFCSQGFVFPSCYVLLGKWAPPLERGRFTAFVIGGKTKRRSHYLLMRVPSCILDSSLTMESGFIRGSSIYITYAYNEVSEGRLQRPVLIQRFSNT